MNKLLAVQDVDDAEIIDNFLARWPVFKPTEIEELHTIAFQLNAHLAELRSQHQSN